MKNKSVLRKEAKEKRRQKRKRIYFIAELLFCIALICGGIGLWQMFHGKVVEADTSDEWEATDLTHMEAPTLTSSTQNFTITTARTTFYDVYSDSQVWDWNKNDYRDSVGAITDGNKAPAENDGNTFARFNYRLSNSENKNGVPYYNMYEARTTASSGVYPLYCGISWPGDQTLASRWGSWYPDADRDVNHGWWFAAANCNQYDNKKELISNEGTPGNTKGAAAQGLVNRELDEDGNITIGHGDAMRVLPYFDEEYLNEPYAKGKVTQGHVVSNIAFPFRQGDGTTRAYMSETDKNTNATTSKDYYYFDSYLDVIQLNEKDGSGNVTYYHGTENVKDTDGKNGFFPFNTAADSNSARLNYVFGTKMELNFNMTSDGKIKGNDIIFEFTGDDDLWVFVDGYLVLDIGGAHIPIHGSINFAEKKAVVDTVKKDYVFGDTYRNSNCGTNDYEYNKTYNFSKTNQTDDNAKKLYELLSDTNINHKLTIFYMERGKANSNLKIKFNLPQITTMSVGNEIDTENVNDALQTKSFWEACNSHYFKYQLSNKGTKAEDVDNALAISGQSETNWERMNLPAIGLTEKLRKKITSTDGVPLRYRFFTFTGKNYYSMVLPKTKVGYVDASNFAVWNDDISKYTANIDGQTYVFKGWTTDKNYYDHWNEIKAGTYIGKMPETIESSGELTARESQDFYAVWAKQEVTITYLDQPDVDTPGFGYDSGNITMGTKEINTTNVTGEFRLPTDSDEMVAKWESSDAHRKGYRLVGWQLEPTDPKNDVDIDVYTSFASVPLHNLTLYAKWEKIQTRCIFTVQNVEKVRDNAGNDTAVANAVWKSNIVYFDIGTKVRFPYMDDTYKTENLSGMFDSLPIRDCHGITEWSNVVPNGVDEDSKTYKSGNNGTRWTVSDKDTEFTGTWDKVYSNITFDASDTIDGTKYDFGAKTVRYAVGESIQSKPEITAIWSDGDVPKIELYKVTGWKNDGKEIKFPYKVTQDDENWEAEWSKVYCKVTYRFDTNNNIDCGETISYKQYFDVGSKIQTPGLESLRGNAPKDKNGTEKVDDSTITYYMTGKDGKAYVISGWSYKEDGSEPVSNSDEVEDKTVYAVWKEVKTSVTFHVFVEGKNNNTDDSEWDEVAAQKAGWTWTWADSGNASKEWKLTLECTPGKSYKEYTDKTTGEYKNKLYAADVQSDKCLYDMKDINGWALSYGGSDDAVSDKIMYTANKHSSHLYAIWGKKKNTVQFIACEPTNTTNNDFWNGVLTYPISKTTLTAAEMPNPDNGDVIYNSDTKAEIILPEHKGYKIAGWVLPNTTDVLKEWNIEDGAVLYANWVEESAYTADDNTTITSNQDIANGAGAVAQSVRKTSLLRALSFSGSSNNSYEKVGDTWYQISDDHFVAGDGNGIGKTDYDGNFYLRYDQIASFLNCFTSGNNPSNMKLKEYLTLYKKNNNTYSENLNCESMYDTTWELRDLHDFITDRTKSGSVNLEKMQKRDSDTDGIYIYDGRAKEQNGNIDTNAFLFQNENQATGASYATNVRAIFTHSVKTGEISITKNMTDFAQDNMDMKKDSEREFTFYVYFYNLFGGSGNSAIDDKKELYEGEYIKLDVNGKIIKDNDGNAVTFTAEDGRILIKAGETALIKGIPVLTKYQIEEETMKLARRAYVMSTAEEVVTKGLGSENTKYIVKDKGDTSEDIAASGSASYEIGVITNKNSNEDVDISGQITGQIGQAGQTYNYIVENDISIDGVQINIEKLIDRFYYAPEEEYLEDKTYQEMTGARQSFVFNVKCTPVDDDGTPNADSTTTVQQVISFSPDDEELTSQRLQSTGKKGWKKSAIIYGKAGYYEVTEDRAWSWKYDLRRIELSDAKKWKTPDTVFDGTGSNVVCRFYIPPADDETGGVNTNQPAVGSEVEWNGQKYRVLMSNPVITFENTITTGERADIKGDTDIKVNEIAKQTPAPTPKPTAKPRDKYTEIRIAGNSLGTLRTGETYTLPSVLGVKSDGSTEVISSGVTWSSSNGSVCSVNNNNLVANKADSNSVTLTAIYQDVKGEWTASMKVEVHNVVTIYYANSAWNPSRINYGIGNGAWTTAPYPEMEPTSEKYGYDWKYVIDLGTKTIVYVCFTNGSNGWDPGNSGNFMIDTAEKGYVVGISGGNINKIN